MAAVDRNSQSEIETNGVSRHDPGLQGLRHCEGVAIVRGRFGTLGEPLADQRFDGEFLYGLDAKDADGRDDTQSN